MTNIHGFNDLEQREDTKSSVPNNLVESFTSVFCPRFTYRSISFASIVLYVFLFFSLWLVSWLSGIQYHCILYYLGALHPPALMRFQLHRLVLPTFYHADFMHLMNNVISTFFLCFSIEHFLGIKRFLILYLGSSVYGYLLSAAALPKTFTVGASGAIMGMFGYYIICIFFGLRQMDNRSYIIFASMIFINLLFILSSSSGNFFAHLGGVISGAIISLIQADERSDLTVWKRWAKVAAAAYPAVCIAWFLYQRVEYSSPCP